VKCNPFSLQILSHRMLGLDLHRIVTIVRVVIGNKSAHSAHPSYITFNKPSLSYKFKFSADLPSTSKSFAPRRSPSYLIYPRLKSQRTIPKVNWRSDRVLMQLTYRLLYLAILVHDCVSRDDVLGYHMIPVIGGGFQAPTLAFNLIYY
jgi:hypothetical protein